MSKKKLLKVSMYWAVEKKSRFYKVKEFILNGRDGKKYVVRILSYRNRTTSLYMWPLPVETDESICLFSKKYSAKDKAKMIESLALSYVLDNFEDRKELFARIRREVSKVSVPGFKETLERFGVYDTEEEVEWGV